MGELAGDPIELKNGDVLEFGICKDPGQQNLVPKGCRGERSSKQTQMLLFFFNLVSVMESCANSVYTCPHWIHLDPIFECKTRHLGGERFCELSFPQPFMINGSMLGMFFYFSGFYVS